MRISDWSSDVCSSDLREGGPPGSSFSSPHRKAGWAGGSHGPATMPQEPMIELQQEQSRNSSGLMELGLNRAKVLTLPQLWQVTLTCCQGVSFISPPFCFADARPDAGAPFMQVAVEDPAPHERKNVV